MIGKPSFRLIAAIGDILIDAIGDILVAFHGHIVKQLNGEYLVSRYVVERRQAPLTESLVSVSYINLHYGLFQTASSCIFNSLRHTVVSVVYEYSHRCM